MTDKCREEIRQIQIERQILGLVERQRQGQKDNQVQGQKDSDRDTKKTSTLIERQIQGQKDSDSDTKQSSTLIDRQRQGQKDKYRFRKTPTDLQNSLKNIDRKAHTVVERQLQLQDQKDCNKDTKQTSTFLDRQKDNYSDRDT